MKKSLTVATGIVAGATLMMLTAPAMAGGVDIGVNIGLPGVYVQPRPVYVEPETVYVQTHPVYIQPEHEQEWRERQLRARRWQEERGHDHREHDRDEQHGHDN